MDLFCYKAGTALLAIALVLGHSATAQAETCILDIDGDGSTKATDGDQGASSSREDSSAGSTDDTNLACGATAAARGTRSTAIGYNSQAGYFDEVNLRTSANATAIGANAIAHGNFGTALGYGARAGSYDLDAGVPDRAMALGYSAVALDSDSAAIGSEARAGGIASLAIGWLSKSSAQHAVAIGAGSLASGDSGIALGEDSLASGARGLATGKAAFASGEEANAIGFQSGASAVKSTAVGSSARATTDKATAIGERAAAGGHASVAVGHDAITTGGASFGIAIGAFSRATNRQSMAIGYRASSTAANSMALGYEAIANRTNATAIGYRAATSAQNQIMLGGVGTSVALGDIAASNAVQIGAEQIVTIDQNGTLGVQDMALFASSRALPISTGSFASVSDAGFDILTDRIGRVEQRVGAIEAWSELVDERLANFDLRMEGLEGGIASAMALGSPVAVPGKQFSFTLAAATYGGQQAFAGLLTGRVGESVYVSAGVTGNSADKRVGTRVSASVGF